MREYCVTGGTGFIATYLVKTLLEKGHVVRTTVRCPENAETVRFLWELKGAKERLKIFEADLMVQGSFDRAIQGVDGVFPHRISSTRAIRRQSSGKVTLELALHVAQCGIWGVTKALAQAAFVFGSVRTELRRRTPPDSLHSDSSAEANLIDPCIKGTLNVLGSCTKASSVKRVVLTSSCSSIRYRDDVQHVSPLNESHWSDLEYCKRYNLWYAYAKTIAEKEAWKIAEESEIDLVVVNPSFVVGPLLAPQPTSTLQLILSVVKGLRGEYPNTTVGFVHIDDVVAAHILAMEESKASGRLICSSTVAHWSEIIEMLRAKYPSYPFEDRCGEQKGDNNPHSMNSDKIIQLGLSPLKPLDQMFDDCIKSFQGKGFL
ncbi:NAD(P)-binding Rossmann-fold superfamily protein [Actinidia rufa]|uniref:Dihydroflavonol 4-reductase n=1 Tax=Actinidia rufa TaxID=165716 RepID=A0A7J0HED8_9ERIC|nr:NAD(P)-binding Rossmann-fold superfamily protein [Actinidia rufa]